MAAGRRGEEALQRLVGAHQLTDLDALWRSQIPTIGPAWLARAEVAVALGLGLGVAVGAIVALDTSAALRTAAILRAGQMLGAIEWTLARSIDYAGERKQFGREISKFQVIQQMLAELASHMLASAGIAEAAADAGSETLIAAARSRLGDAADAAIGIGHQVHGAMGFSKEYALNHRTRRLIASIICSWMSWA